MNKNTTFFDAQWIWHDGEYGENEYAEFADSFISNGGKTTVKITVRIFLIKEKIIALFAWPSPTSVSTQHHWRGSNITPKQYHLMIFGATFKIAFCTSSVFVKIKSLIKYFE